MAAEDASLSYVEIPGLGSVCDMCLGTMTLTSQVPEDADCFAICDTYVEMGGNFIDTAEVYPFPMNPEAMGNVEKMLGRWLSTGTVQRDQIVLATKCAGYIPAPLVSMKRVGVLGLEEDKILPESGFSDVSVRQGVEASLVRLQTNYIDLYQLHWPDRYVPLWGKSEYKFGLSKAHQHNPALVRELGTEYYEEVVETMGALIAEGKIKAWGISNETSFGVCMWCETAKRLGVPLPSTIQNDFSMCDRRFETELAEACKFYNVKLIAYGCLNGGFLSDKYFCENPIQKGSRHTDFAPNSQLRYAEQERTRPAAEKYYALAQENGLTLEAMAYSWARTRNFMASVIIGVSSLDQLKYNMEVAAKMTLAEDVVVGIDMVNWSNPSPNVGEKPAAPGTKPTGLSLQEAMEKDTKKTEETAAPAVEETATAVVQEAGAGQPAEEATA